MEKHTCKLCSCRFFSGRALGGHMRSHMTAAAPAGKPAFLPDISTSSEESSGAYTLRENPRKSFRIADPEFSSSVAVLDGGGSSVVVQDGESETESPTPSRNPSCHRRRSKRRRRVLTEPEPASSVSDGTEEDVAISLMMLSRDVWTEPPSPVNVGEEEQIRRFQCEECRRVFRSYQALGGHRASHKKVNQGCLPAAAGNAGGQKVHECPVCFRVFGSGQALGGHKRSQLCSTIAARTAVQSAIAAPKVSFIDLNMPAPAEDDAIEMELSAVSDAEFVKNYQTDPVSLSFR